MRIINLWTGVKQLIISNLWRSQVCGSLSGLPGLVIFFASGDLVKTFQKWHVSGDF